jgi:hypothetical protein
VEEQRQTLYNQAQELNEKLAAIEQEESETAESRTSLQHCLKELKVTITSTWNQTSGLVSGLAGRQANRQT